jgi:hypothetical protein
VERSRDGAFGQKEGRVARGVNGHDLMGLVILSGRGVRFGYGVNDLGGEERAEG